MGDLFMSNNMVKYTAEKTYLLSCLLEVDLLVYETSHPRPVA